MKKFISLFLLVLPTLVFSMDADQVWEKLQKQLNETERKRQELREETRLGLERLQQDKEDQDAEIQSEMALIKEESQQKTAILYEQFLASMAKLNTQK